MADSRYGFIAFPVETDPEALVELSIDYLQTQIPGWEPAEGQVEVWLAEAVSYLAAEVRDVASDVPLAIFRYLGGLVGVDPIEQTEASADSTWTLTDDLGHTIEQGTQVTLEGAEGPIGFEVVDDVTVAPGDTATAAGEVALVAIDAGADGTDLSGPASLVDSLEFVDEITLVAATQGGIDAEADDLYLDRLSDQLTLLTPRPILPSDFEKLALTIPGVGRALAIDLLNPNTGATTEERTVTVALRDADGEAVSAPIKAAVDALLQAEREVNFVVFVIDPTYTTVAVDFDAVAWPGYDETEVEEAAESAVTEYLSPANWGQPPTGELTVWYQQPYVRFLEVAEVINSVEGLSHITSLTVAGASVDVLLSGYAPLPRAGAITGDVVAS